MALSAAARWQRRQARRAFFKHLFTTRVSTADAFTVLQSTAQMSAAEIEAIAAQEGISQAALAARMAAANVAVDRVMDQAFEKIIKTVTKGARRNAQIAVDHNLEILDNVTKQLPKQMKNMIMTTASQAAESIVSKNINNIALSQQVYKTAALSKGLVKREITKGMIQGKSAKEIAAAVRHMINPKTPGGVSFAAMRLARTELNNAFHTTTIRTTARMPWVGGYKWELSSSHKKDDVCNRYANTDHSNLGPGVFAKTNVPFKPHPQCLCYVITETLPEEEFLQALDDGEFDKYLNEGYTNLDDLPGWLSSGPVLMATGSVFPTAMAIDLKGKQDYLAKKQYQKKYDELGDVQKVVIDAKVKETSKGTGSIPEDSDFLLEVPEKANPVMDAIAEQEYAMYYDELGDEFKQDVYAKWFYGDKEKIENGIIYKNSTGQDVTVVAAVDTPTSGAPVDNSFDIVAQKHFGKPFAELESLDQTFVQNAKWKIDQENLLAAGKLSKNTEDVGFWRKVPDHKEFDRYMGETQMLDQYELYVDRHNLSVRKHFDVDSEEWLDASWYKGSGYEPINDLLRDRWGTRATRLYSPDDWAFKKRTKKAIRNIDNLIDNFEIPENMILWRGGKMTRLIDLAKKGKAVGARIQDMAFMSTSVDHGAAAAFTYEGRDKALMRLRVPARTRGVWLETVRDYTGSEVEVLLERELTYKILDVRWNKNLGYWEIDAEVELPPGRESEGRRTPGWST